MLLRILKHEEHYFFYIASDQGYVKDGGKFCMLINICNFLEISGVSGGTASGKTTVCDMIIQQLHDHRVVLVNQV